MLMLSVQCMRPTKGLGRVIAAQRCCQIFGLGHVRTMGSNYGSGGPRRVSESPPVYVFIFRTWSSEQG